MQLPPTLPVRQPTNPAGILFHVRLWNIGGGYTILQSAFRERNTHLGNAILWILLSGLGLAGCGGSSAIQQPPSPSPPSQAPPTPQQAGSVTISPENAAVGAGQKLQFRATAANGGTLTWSVNGVAGGSAASGTIDANGLYTTPSVNQSVNAIVQAALASSPQTNFASAPVAVIAPSQVLKTANPQVAVYAIYLPQPGSVAIHFGTDTSYGLQTWSEPTPGTPNNYGGEVNIEVAGMRGSMRYHMRAQVTLANGTVYDDVDHNFTTGATPPVASLQVNTTSGQIPQPGIELFDTAFSSRGIFGSTIAAAFATDIAGNVLWTYTFSGTPANLLFPIRPLPNGDFLAVISYVASIGNQALQSNGKGAPVPPGTINVIREIDLAGNTIHELSIPELTQSLAANGFSNLSPTNFHHDVLPLPNGHFVLLSTISKAFTNLPGYPGTTNVLGDLVIDVDQDFKPDWVWNTFDHLDVNRHPMVSMFPDWTHANSLLYSADDHNLLLSLPYQNWILKLDFQDGQGNGNILWRLGQGGDFKLLNGVDPIDWFYTQHGPNYFTPNTTGVFKLGVMDNGDDRIFPTGVTCGSAGAPVCQYSTVDVLQIDEQARTATLQFHYVPSPNLYSYFGGNADLLSDGDIEADFAAVNNASEVLELNPAQAGGQTVWQANTPGNIQYRAVRLPSLYPGVQW